MIKKIIRLVNSDLKKNANDLYTVLSFSIFTTLAILLSFYNKILSYNPSINNFSEHIMSSATAANLSIGSRVLAYQSLLLLCLILFFAILSLFYYLYKNHYQKRNTDQHNNSFNLVRDISYIGIFSAVASILTTKDTFSSIILVGAIIFLLLNILRKKEHISETIFLWLSAISVPITIFIFVNLKTAYSQLILFNYPTLFFSVIWSYVLILLGILTRRLLHFNKQEYKIVVSSIPIFSIAILQSISLETLNILNMRFNLVFDVQRELLNIISTISVLLSIAIYKYLGKNSEKDHINKSPKKLIETILVPLSLLSMLLLSIQPSKMITIGNEFFEVANHGLAIDHFFRYGKIPFVETFDAHMLYKQITGYLFSFLNGYEPWSFLLYENLLRILFIIPLYFFLKKIIGSSRSFFLILVFPLLSNIFYSLFITSVIVVFSALKLLKNKQPKDHFLFWFVSLLLSTYRLDVGFASLLAGFTSILIGNYIYQRKLNIKLFLMSGIITLSSFIGAFLLLIFLKGASPLSRLTEFLLLLSSNQNWAYASLGDTKQFAFIIGYYILPFFAIFSSMIIFLRELIINSNNRDKSKPINEVFILFVFFILFFFFNIPRGIVRHSFKENTIALIISTLPLALVSLSAFSKKNTILKFIGISLVVLILSNSTKTSFLKTRPSLISSAVTSTSYWEQYGKAYFFNNTRVKGSKLNKEAHNLKLVIDTLLDDSETYFDLSSHNYYHALIQRENPVYVNQSPLMISGDTSQHLALDQIKMTKTPIALVPRTGKHGYHIDGIAVNYKYYLISEYIYSNYEPLLRFPNFDIYALKDNIEIYKKDLEKNNIVVSDVLSSPIFDNNDFSSFKMTNVDVKTNEQNQIVFTSKSSFSSVTGFLNQLKDKLTQINNDFTDKLYTEIVFDIHSQSTGVLGIEYTIVDDDNNKKIQYKEFPITTIGDSQIKTSFNSFPNESKMIFKGLKQLSIKQISVTRGAQIVSEQHGNKPVNLGLIPIIWADDSKKFIDLKNQLNQETIKNTTQFKVPNIESSYPIPGYLLLSLESPIKGEAKIEISEQDKTVGTISFTILDDTHFYLFRLGADSYWWNNNPKNITLSTDNPIDIRHVQILSDSEVSNDLR